ncbi:zeta toxin family protein [Herbiconiux sp. YIM B11900]|uniref:zeta toxin family protein n=1 Tax=Herbiconiux sp. YIM B11900 TaxID=3404131 RepID=UPI003F834E75
MHTDSPRSTANHYSDAQRAIRGAEVAAEFLAAQTAVERNGRVAVVTAGPPGGGKTTALQIAGFDATYRNIDPDIIKEHLVRRALKDRIYDDLLGRTLTDGLPIRPMELSSLVHRESVAISENIAAVSLRAGENVILQGSLAWEEQPARLLTQLKENEYGVLTILDVEAELATVLERAMHRWWLGRNDSSDPLGGRFVPRHLIEGLFLPSGGTKCRANAEVMLALSTIPSTSLHVSSHQSGTSTVTVTTKDGFRKDSLLDEV